MVYISPMDALRLLLRTWCRISGWFSQYVYFFSQNDFVLRIAPLKNPYTRLFCRTRKHREDYFPPPGYGIPPRKKSTIETEPYTQYGLFLWPGKLTREFFFFMLTVNSFIVFPFVFNEHSWMKYHPVWFGVGFIIIMSLLSALLFRIVFKIMPPVLFQIWKVWPESQYANFLTVPHIIELKRKDKKRERREGDIYWHPDDPTPMRHQSSSYASGMNTLQEVMLHLAIFDFFFHKKAEKELGSEQYKSIKVGNWITYLLSPVWITYSLLLLFFFLYQLEPPKFSLDKITLFQYPYNFAWATVSWFILSSYFIAKRIKSLKKQEAAVVKGYYDAHLELVPQQILNVITTIPDEDQIRGGIEKMATLLRTIQTVGLFGMFMLIEIFSSPYSQLTPSPEKLPITSSISSICETHNASKK